MSLTTFYMIRGFESKIELGPCTGTFKGFLGRKEDESMYVLRKGTLYVSFKPSGHGCADDPEIQIRKFQDCLTERGYEWKIFDPGKSLPGWDDE